MGEMGKTDTLRVPKRNIALLKDVQTSRARNHQRAAVIEMDQLIAFQGLQRSFEEIMLQKISGMTVEKVWDMVQYNGLLELHGAKEAVGKDFSKREALELALQHWLEAIDSLHRYGHNWHLYFEIWLHFQSREPFFYWLDPVWKTSSPLEQQCIKYLGSMAKMDDDGFVLLEKFNKQIGKHSSFLAAGKFVMGRGTLQSRKSWLSNYTLHGKPPYQQKSWSEKRKMVSDSQSNVFNVLLLASTLIAIITFHTALKFPLPGLGEAGFNDYVMWLLIKFNSVAFFVSTATIMILFTELPFSPWLQISVFSMIASYMCI